MIGGVFVYPLQKVLEDIQKNIESVFIRVNLRLKSISATD